MAYIDLLKKHPTHSDKSAPYYLPYMVEWQRHQLTGFLAAKNPVVFSKRRWALKKKKKKGLRITSSVARFP